jgi:hypothetical protein
MMTLEQHYEHGLKTLKERARNTQWLTDFLTLEARLRENLSQTHRYGDTETRRADRAQIVNALNDLALQHLGVDFNDLCGIDSLSEPASPGSPQDQTSDGNVVWVERGSIETNQLLQESERPGAPNIVKVSGKIKAKKIHQKAKR